MVVVGEWVGVRGYLRKAVGPELITFVLVSVSLPREIRISIELLIVSPCLLCVDVMLAADNFKWLFLQKCLARGERREISGSP